MADLQKFGLATRRGLLAAAGGVGLGVGLGRRAFGAMAASPAPRMAGGYVDVHHHLTPPSWAEHYEKEGGYSEAFQGATLAQALAEMDRDNVAVSINTVLQEPLVESREELIALTRDANEFLAKIARDNPKRMGVWAHMPMPYIDATLKEIEYAFDTLHVDGIKLSTSTGRKWLGDPDFAPVYEELNRRKAIVYTHPGEDACCVANVRDVPQALIEFGTSTARAMAELLFSGSAAKYSDIKFIFSHAGGTFPYLIRRFLLQAATDKGKAVMPQGLEYYVRRFYFDTAQSYHPVPMRALKDTVPVSQILLGTDWPYRSVADTMNGIASVFSATELAAISGGNIRKLLPRFAA